MCELFLFPGEPEFYGMDFFGTSLTRLELFQTGVDLNSEHLIYRFFKS